MPGIVNTGAKENQNGDMHKIQRVRNSGCKRRYQRIEAILCLLRVMEHEVQEAGAKQANGKLCRCDIDDMFFHPDERDGENNGEKHRTPLCDCLR